MTAQQEGNDLAQHGKQKLNALQLDIKVAVADPLGDVAYKVTNITSIIMKMHELYKVLTEDQQQQVREHLPITPEGGGPVGPRFG